MNKRGVLLGKVSITTIIIISLFLVILWVFPVNPEDISGNLVKQEIIKTINPKTNTDISEDSVKIIVTTEKSALCKSSKMKFSGYYLPYVDFKRTNDYYHETTVSLESGRNNFKIYCRRLDANSYDYNYWSIKKV